MILSCYFYATDLAEKVLGGVTRLSNLYNIHVVVLPICLVVMMKEEHVVVELLTGRVSVPCGSLCSIEQLAFVLTNKGTCGKYLKHIESTQCSV